MPLPNVAQLCARVRQCILYYATKILYEFTQIFNVVAKILQNKFSVSQLYHDYVRQSILCSITKVLSQILSDFAKILPKKTIIYGKWVVLSAKPMLFPELQFKFIGYRHSRDVFINARSESQSAEFSLFVGFANIYKRRRGVVTYNCDSYARADLLKYVPKNNQLHYTEFKLNTEH